MLEPGVTEQIRSSGVNPSLPRYSVPFQGQVVVNEVHNHLDLRLVGDVRPHVTPQGVNVNSTAFGVLRRKSCSSQTFHPSVYRFMFEKTRDVAASRAETAPSPRPWEGHFRERRCPCKPGPFE